MSIEDRIAALEKDVSEIQSRNRRVEQDKGWEVSLYRRLLISCMTYVFTVIVFMVAGLDKPLLNASITVVGYLISTLTVGVARDQWIERAERSRER